MKKIFYSLALAAMAFASCKPLNKTYEEIGDIPAPAAPAVSVTLVAADYKLLNKGAAAYTSGYFKSLDTVKAQVPTILASKYPSYSEKASVTVTYATTPTTVKLADSLNANTAITLQTTPTNDYVYPAYNGNAANTFSDFSATSALNYLYYRYQGASQLTEPALRVMTYLYFESGKTASSGTLTTDAFLFSGGVWSKIYRISNAQYALTNNALNNWYVAGDVANLPFYFNTYLKADPTIMLTAKVGTVVYVNYRYLTTYQRVLPMTYDGTNWVTTPTTASLVFVKTNGVWVPDNTVNYTLTQNDMKGIGTAQTTVASASAVANLASFGNYNIQGGATTWTDDQITTSISVFLKTKYTNAVLNQRYVITYAAYNGTNITPVKIFVYNGTTFVIGK